MTDWKSRFEELKVRVKFPDAPNSTNLREAIDIVDRIINNTLQLNLLHSPESKIVIKCKANDYQRKHFNEDYVFRFQSLIDGRQSQIIPNNEKSCYGILDRYSKTGGPFPSILPIKSNTFTCFSDHYNKLRGELYYKLWTLNKAYYIAVNGAPESWWNVYSEYLMSPEWESKKNLIHRLYNEMCSLCGSTVLLHVHHITYKNVGHEDMEDLILVCKECHEEIHGRKL